MYQCYELRCEGKVIGGFEADLWKIRAAALQYPRATAPMVAAARVARARGTPAREERRVFLLSLA
jgi:hypothetical protein